MKFRAVTHTEDGRLTRGAVYYGSLVTLPKGHGQLEIRIAVYDNHNEWMRFAPHVFKPVFETHNFHDDKILNKEHNQRINEARQGGDTCVEARDAAPKSYWGDIPSDPEKRLALLEESNAALRKCIDAHNELKTQLEERNEWQAKKIQELQFKLNDIIDVAGEKNTKLTWDEKKNG